MLGRYASETSSAARGPTSLSGVLRLKESAGGVYEKAHLSLSAAEARFVALGSETSRSSTPVTDASTYQTPSSVSSWGTTAGSQVESGECSYPGEDEKRSRDRKWDEESLPVRSRRPSEESPMYPTVFRPPTASRSNNSDKASTCSKSGSAKSNGVASPRQKSDVSDTESCMADDEDRENDDDDEYCGEDDGLDAAVIAAVDGDLALAAYLIPLLHRSFSSAVRTKVEAWQCGSPGGGSAGGRSSDSQHAGSSASGGNRSPIAPRKRRRRTSSGDGERAGDGDGGDDDDEGGSGKANSHPETLDAHAPLLACPFHKLNPAKYGIQHGATSSNVKSDYYRACAGPGFKTIQRLKEHLKRKHTVVQCERCYKIFRGNNREASQQLTQHSRSSESCQIGDAALREGINNVQWALLDKQNRKKPQETHKLEKWFEIWEILFPNNDKPKTPWYDGLSIASSGQSTPESEQFATIFVNILTHKVRQGDIALQADENTMGRLKNVVEQTFRTWVNTRDDLQLTDASSSLAGSALHSSSRVGGSSTHLSGPSNSASQQLTASSYNSGAHITIAPALRHPQQQQHAQQSQAQQQAPQYHTHALGMQPGGGPQYIAMPMGRQPTQFSGAMGGPAGGAAAMPLANFNGAMHAAGPEDLNNGCFVVMQPQFWAPTNMPVQFGLPFATPGAAHVSPSEYYNTGTEDNFGPSGAETDFM
ncbi:hypothetical protein RB594_003328 [Gaeumannomyces avenae]